MFLLCSHHPNEAGHILNAVALTPDREIRRARHLRQAERLAEMAINLAEAAHTQALRDAQPPPELPQPTRPGMPAYMPRPTRAAYDSTLASNFFQEFSRCARQAILLEARLDSGAYDNAPNLQNFAEHAGHQRETHAPTRPRQPSDETRLHHERLQDEYSPAILGQPEHALQTIAADLDTAIAETRAAGLDFSPRNAPASPPPEPHDLKKPAPAPHPATQPTQARPRASPARSARP